MPRVAPDGRRRRRFSGSVTEARVAAFIAQHVGDRVERVVLDSPGGDVLAALALANWIVDRHADVEVEKLCASSCANDLFAAGRRKIIDDRAIVVWHGSLLQKDFRDRCDASLHDDADGTYCRDYRDAVATQQAFFARVHVDETITRLGQEPVSYRAIWTVPVDVMARNGPDPRRSARRLRVGRGHPPLRHGPRLRRRGPRGRARALIQLNRVSMTSIMDHHPAKILWTLHHPKSGYPPGTLGVPEPIAGRAFFPGGYGLWGAARGQRLPPFPVGGFMVLGHDFHSETGYQASFDAGAERLTLPTWRNLIFLLDRHGIAKEQCFFTNAYMGLRSSRSAIGDFAGASDPVFVAHCQDFLRTQISSQRPKMIMSLGIHVPPILAAISPDLGAWKEGRGVRHLDKTDPIGRNVTFDKIADYRTTVVALLHPSLRHASLRHRRFRGLVGADAEDLMITEAMNLAMK